MDPKSMAITRKFEQRNKLKKLYLDVSIMTAKADGIVLKEEIDTIFSGLKNIGLTYSEEEIDRALLESEKNIDSLDLTAVKNAWEKESLLSLMLLISYSDNNISPEETALIEEISEKLSVALDRVNELKNIILEARNNALS